MNVVFLKPVDVVYAADYNQQRAILTEFFFPWDFQDREVTPVPQPVSTGSARACGGRREGYGGWAEVGSDTIGRIHNGMRILVGLILADGFVAVTNTCI